MSYISAKDLSIGYDGKPVLGEIHFQVEKGNYLCVVGENGSGKTTLMKTILGLIPPINGRILYGDGLKKNQIGYLPQQTELQKDFPASGEEVVLSGFQGKMGMRPFYKKEEKKQADLNMERVHIGGLKHKSYRELSGGQKQRVLLARALCAANDMLVLDEPVTGLDPKVTLEMYDLIADLNHLGITIIMISHDLDAAMKYSSHILHIDKKLFFGPTRDYQSSKQGNDFLQTLKEEEDD